MDKDGIATLNKEIRWKNYSESVRMAAFLTIFVLTADRIAITISGLNITGGKILAVIMILLVAIQAIYSGRARTGGSGGILLASWLILSLVVNIYQNDTSNLLKHWINLVAAIAWFYIVVNSPVTWQKIQNVIVRVAEVLGLCAVIVLFIRELTNVPSVFTDYFISREVGMERLAMFSWEPNIFGSTVAIGILMTLPGLRKNAIRAITVIGILGISLVGALSKGPWVSFMIGMGTYIILTRESRAIRLYLVINIIVISVVAVLACVYKDYFESNLIRVDNISVRLLVLISADKDIVLNPIFGNGTFSIGTLWPYLNMSFGSTEEHTIWIAQAAIGVLHDTGVVGLLIITMFWISIIWRAVRAINLARRHNSQRNLQLFSSAILASAITLLIQDWATTLYDLPIYWAVMGMVALIPRWFGLNQIAQMGSIRRHASTATIGAVTRT